MPSIKELKESIINHVGEVSFQAMKFTEKSEMEAFLEKVMKRAMKRKTGMFLCERGKYILGDPCYIAVDVCDLETFNETYYDPDDEDENQEEDENNVRKEKRGEPRFHDGWEVSAALNTRFTSPTWCSDSTDSYSFLINSGVVCLMPLSYNPKFNEENAHIIEFDEDFECRSERGILHFGHIKINTARPKAKSKEDSKSSSSSSSSSSSASSKKKKDEYMKDDFVVDDEEEEEVNSEEDDSDDESEYRESSSDEEENENDYERHKRRKKRKR